MSSRMFWSSLLSVAFVASLPIDAQAFFGKRGRRNACCQPCPPPCIVWVPCCEVVALQPAMQTGAASDDSLPAPKKPELKKIPDSLPKLKAPPGA